MLHDSAMPHDSAIAHDSTGTALESPESAVRSYSRSFPATFTTAKGDWLFTEGGTRYIDFLAGAGSLNYGHNPEAIKQSLLEYIESDGLTHGLDLATAAKAVFLDAFREDVLEPR